MVFSELDLHPDLLKSIDELGFESCTEVQEKTFKSTFQGSDVIIQSKTGTGKTAAFLISIFNHFTTCNENTRKFALILAPTRELALQIEKEAIQIGKYLPYKIATFYGGVGYKKQEMQLAEGVDIMIATPGRLIDFIKSKKINISDVTYFVVDEADRMFDLGFSKDIEFIVRKLPGSDKRRTILLSATINRNVKIFAGKFIHDPVEIDLSPDQLIVENVEHYVVHVSLHEKFNFLLGLLEKQKPKTAFIFTNTKQAAIMVAEKLKLHGVDAEYIIGDLPQAKRTTIINKIKENKIPFLVATDVAARGIHVNELDMVINYDLPEDPENYVHRVGRTARAGMKGVAYSFVCERFVYGLEPLENFLDIKIPVFWPEDDYFVDTACMDYSSLSSFDNNKRRTGGRGDNRRGDSRRKDRNLIRPEGSRQKRQQPKRSRPSNQDTDEQKRTHARSQRSKSDSRRPDSRKSTSKKSSAPVQQAAAQKRSKQITKKNMTPKRKHDLDKRLKMYAEKYGEDFSVAGTEKAGVNGKKGKGILSQVASIISSLFKK